MRGEGNRKKLGTTGLESENLPGYSIELDKELTVFVCASEGDLDSKLRSVCV